MSASTQSKAISHNDFTPLSTPSSTPPERPNTLTPLARRRISRRLRFKQAEILRAWDKTHFNESRLKQFGVSISTPRETLHKTYLRPLLDLLLAFISTGEGRYRDVYLNERLRFSPRRSPPSIRNSFFIEVLTEDESTLLSFLDRDIDRLTLAAILNEVHKHLYMHAAEAPLRMLALGDCLMGEVSTSLASACNKHHIALDFRQLYFSALMGKEASIDQVLALLDDFKPDFVAISFLSYEGIPPYTALLRESDRLSDESLRDRVTGVLALMRRFLDKVREHTDATFLLHNASGLPLTRFRKWLPVIPVLSAGRLRALRILNQAIEELVSNTPNSILIDERAIAAKHGLRRCSSPLIPRSVSRHSAFHTTVFSSFIATPYLNVALAFHTFGKAKVLLIDFDNTLWEGVMADGPVTQRKDFQLLLRSLKDAGILLVAVSKNDPRNIRWNEMILQPDDFALMKISWDLKVQSIREAASQLNLGLQSFVLLDDNPVERELVSNSLPEVRTADPLAAATIQGLKWMFQFPITRNTEEARLRTQMYREQAQRREAMSESCDYPAMMAALHLRVRFKRIESSDIDRVTELIHRTNQFNTTTIRYTKPELLSLMRSKEHAIYVASLSDKFGDTGLVCVAIIHRDGDARIFESFVMSCRAMGFDLERLMLRLVVDEESAGAKTFIGRIVKSERNGPSQGLYSANGFTKVSDEEWRLCADADRPQLPKWFSITRQ